MQYIFTKDFEDIKAGTILTLEKKIYERFKAEYEVFSCNNKYGIYRVFTKFDIQDIIEYLRQIN